MGVRASVRVNPTSDPVRLLVLQPTPFCNFDCGYCYLPTRLDRSRMSLETVQRAVELITEIGVSAPLNVSWHAGEPLIVSPSWYRKAHEIFTRAFGAEKLRFNFQTNGSLLSEEWVEFLKEEPRARLGLSIDGPRELHDARRKTRDGKGTHHWAMRAVERLARNAIEYDCIAVISWQTLSQPQPFFRFFQQIGPSSLALNPEEIEGPHLESTMAEPRASESYEDFLCELFRLWLEAGRPFRIREVDRIERQVALLKSGGASELADNWQVQAWRIVSVDVRGGVHTFSPELLGTDLPRVGKSLGKLGRDSFADIDSSETLELLRSQIAAGVGRCAEACEYFPLCGGGAPSNKWFELRTFTAAETRYCVLAIQAPVRAYLRATSSAARKT